MVFTILPNKHFTFTKIYTYGRVTANLPAKSKLRGSFRSLFSRMDNDRARWIKMYSDGVGDGDVGEKFEVGVCFQGGLLISVSLGLCGGVLVTGTVWWWGT